MYIGFMKKKRLQTPHDRFFKAMFSKTAVISSFVSTYLFPNTRIDIDFNLSSALKNDTVDGFLNEFRSDIVYRLFNKTNSQFIYLLFEHKSTPDKKTIVQLKHYLNSIENDIPESEKYEGPILIVIYHGRRKWNISLSLDPDQPDPTLNKIVPKRKYLLFDFYHTPDEKIFGSPQLRLTLLALKYVKTRSIIKKIDQILVILEEMTDKKEIGEYVDELALYIDSAAPMDLKEKVLEKIKTAIISGENKMSSIKEYFKEEGRKEGIEQGIKQGFKQGTEQGFKQGTEQGFKQGTEKGIEKVALNMLKNGESTEKVVLYTGLSKEKISSLHEQLMKNSSGNGKARNP
jgi:predicted transposase YdaD